MTIQLLSQNTLTIFCANLFLFNRNVNIFKLTPCFFLTCDTYGVKLIFFIIIHSHQMPLSSSRVKAEFCSHFVTLPGVRGHRGSPDPAAAQVPAGCGNPEAVPHAA